MALKDLSIAETEGRLRELSAATYDGVFIWRISDFSKKRQDAIAGRAPAMFSPGTVQSCGMLLGLPLADRNYQISVIVMTCFYLINELKQ